MDKFKKINTLVSIISFGTILFLLVSYLARRYFNLNFPYVDFMFSPADRFADFYNVNYFIHDLNPYVKGSSYTPFGLMSAYPFSQIPNYSSNTVDIIRHMLSGKLMYLLFLLIFMVCIVIFMYILVRGQGIAKDLYNTFILSIILPVIMVAERGNYMYLTVIMIGLFILFYEKKKNLSVIFLGLAIGYRIYPAFFLVFLIKDKRYKDIIKACAYAIVVNLAIIVFFKGGVISNIKLFVKNLLLFQGGSNKSDIFSLHFSVSFKSIIQIPIMLFNNATVPKYLHLDKIYSILCIVMLLMSAYAIMKESRIWKKVFFSMVAIVCIPATTYEHNLIYFLVPLYLFINEKEYDKSDIAYIILFALIFIPKSYICLFFDPPFYPINLQSFLNATLLFIAWLIFVVSYRKEFFSDIKLLYKKMLRTV